MPWCVGLLAFTAAILNASSTATWEMNSYQDFIHGRFQGISLTREGRLALAPKIESIFSSDQPVVWSVAPAPDGSLYVATGHRGRLYRMDKSGKSSLIWTADQPEIFAVVADTKGAIYAATSPDGKIYRIENGKATEYFAPQAKYIWSLVARRRHALCRHGRSGQSFSRGCRGQGRGAVLNRAVACDGAGNRPERASTRRDGAERHSLPHFRQGQSLRTV
jgi:hypothetical protein